jgi:hypothetical protein
MANGGRALCEDGDEEDLLALGEPVRRRYRPNLRDYVVERDPSGWTNGRPGEEASCTFPSPHHLKLSLQKSEPTLLATFPSRLSSRSIPGPLTETTPNGTASIRISSASPTRTASTISSTPTGPTSTFPPGPNDLPSRSQPSPPRSVLFLACLDLILEPTQPSRRLRVPIATRPGLVGVVQTERDGEGVEMREMVVTASQ